MRSNVKATRKKPRKRRRASAERTVPPPAEPRAPVFDEPATPPRPLNPSIEEPVPRTPVLHDEDVCGLEDRDRTPADDLH